MDQNHPAPPRRATAENRKTAPRPPRRISDTYLHNAGLHYLQRFAASTGQFRKVMMRKVDRSCRFHKDLEKDDCVRMVNELIEKFQRAGLLNDSAYAAGLSASLRRRGVSRRAAEARMRARGLSSEDIEAALDGADGSDSREQDFRALLRLMKRKRIGPFRSNVKEISKAADPTKELAALARAGFSYDDASRALRLAPEEAMDMLLEIPQI